MRWVQSERGKWGLLDEVENVHLTRCGWEDVVRSAFDRASLDVHVDSVRPLVEFGALQPPVPHRPGKILGIGLNYADHIRETGIAAPPKPLVFAKFPSSLTGCGTDIRIDPSLSREVDFEGELAVVVGRATAGNSVNRENALEFVLGYTIANDVTARDLQFRGDGQWAVPKSLDTFCPLGPVLVTPDEVQDPQNLAIRTRLNGKTMQSASTAEMIFDVRDLIVHCAKFFALEPGDVLLSGTPHGVGYTREPPVFLTDGDRIEVAVSGIGVLWNNVSQKASH